LKFTWIRLSQGRITEYFLVGFVVECRSRKERHEELCEPLHVARKETIDYGIYLARKFPGDFAQSFVIEAAFDVLHKKKREDRGVPRVESKAVRHDEESNNKRNYRYAVASART
jgi:hypothetical protein